MARVMEKPFEEWATSIERLASEHPEFSGELRARFALLFGVDEDEENRAPETLDEFTDLREIGRGGMGVVYRARQPSLDRDVALKVIRPERLFFEGARNRFQREVESTAKLAHPGIVSIFSVGGTGVGGVPYFAMELLEGESLSSIVARLASRAPESLHGKDLAGEPDAQTRGIFAMEWPKAIARIGADVARALEHAHASGVVHRDIKPSNVMLERSGRVVLLDFGLTSSTDPGASRATATGAPVGTLVYMAPEQVEGQAEPNAALDVYGLGVTLYELLALQPPFDEPSALGLRAAITGGDVAPIRARNRAIPRDLETVIAKAMDVRVSGRYGSARAFADDLERVIVGEPVSATSPGPFARALRRARRKPAAAAAGILGSLLLVGGPSAYAVLSTRHANDMEELAKAEREARRETEAVNRDLENVLGFTNRMFESADPRVNGGEIPSAVGMLHRGAESLASLEGSAAAKTRIQLMLGSLFSLLLAPAAAERQLNEALAGLRKQTSGDPGERLRLAEALRLSAHNKIFVSAPEEGIPLIEEALEIATGVHGEDSSALHAFLITKADILMNAGKLDQALEVRRRTVGLLEANGEEGKRLEQSRGLLGASLVEAKEFEEARPLLEGSAAWVAADPGRQDTLQDQLELALAQLDMEEGRVDEAIARATATEERLEKREGARSLLTLQAAYLLGRALARKNDYVGALEVFDRVEPLLRDQLSDMHPLRVNVERYRIATLTALGRSPRVVALERETNICHRTEESLGETSDAYRKLIRAVGLSAQAQRQMDIASPLLEKLEAAERKAGAWSPGHADAALMLVAHRMKVAEPHEPDGAPGSEGLLRELMEAAGDEAFAVQSSTNGQTFEGGYMARIFLAFLYDAEGKKTEAAALRQEAEERKTAFTER